MAGWLVMLVYIIQIILSLLLWAFNLSNFYKKLIIVGSIKTTLYTLLITILISVFAFLILVGWGRYNYKRYAHLERRRFPDDVTLDDLVQYFNLPSEIIENMRNNKIIVLDRTII